MKIEEKTDAEILEIVNPLMDNLMDASTEINYERHIRDFSPRLKGILSSADQLEAMCKSYQAKRGFFAERKVIGVYRRPGGVAVLWTQKYTKAEGEFIAEILVIQEGDKYLIDHVMVW